MSDSFTRIQVFKLTKLIFLQSFLHKALFFDYLKGPKNHPGFKRAKETKKENDQRKGDEERK